MVASQANYRTAAYGMNGVCSGGTRRASGLARNPTGSMIDLVIRSV